MSRRKTEELEKVTIRLFKGDADKLADLYPDLGYNVAIRRLVRRSINVIENRARQTLDQSPTTESFDAQLDLNQPNQDSD